MIDPNTDEPVRTWTRMELPERDGDGDRPDCDPFDFSSSKDGDSDS